MLMGKNDYFSAFMARGEAKCLKNQAKYPHLWG